MTIGITDIALFCVVLDLRLVGLYVVQKFRPKKRYEYYRMLAPHRTYGRMAVEFLDPLGRGREGKPRNTTYPIRTYMIAQTGTGTLATSHTRILEYGL